jgi:hypothetical protein
MNTRIHFAYYLSVTYAEKTPKSARRRTSRNRRSLTRIVEKTFFTLSPASGRRSAFIETDRFCRSSHHHHHSSSSPLSRVRARARTNTLARDGSRASRRTRRRRAETGRDRTFGTGASSWVARSPVPSPPSRSFPKPRPACLLIRPRFGGRATHPSTHPNTNAGQRRARLQRHHGGTRGHGLARPRARAPNRSGTYGGRAAMRHRRHHP